MDPPPFLSADKRVLWERLKTEANPNDFGSVSFFIQELSEIRQHLKSVEGFPNIFDRFSLMIHDSFPVFFLIGFRIFLSQFPYFLGSFSECIEKKEETNQQTENLKLFLKTGNRPKKE